MRRPGRIIELRSNDNNNTIAIKTTRTDNRKSRSRNDNPKIRNNGYVIMFLSLLDILNLQSNQGGY